MKRLIAAAALAAGLGVGLALGAGLGLNGRDAPSTREPTGPTTTARSTTTAPGTTATTETEPDEPTIELTTYFLRDEEVAAATRRVPETARVATAALNALIAGPTAAEIRAGLTSRVASTLRFSGLEIEDGVASLELSEPLSDVGLAQVVYTLTQFSTVKRVAVAGRRLGRADFEPETPAILVEAPTPGATISSPVRIRGTANTFEATFVVELLRDPGRDVLFEKVVTATSGTGTRGTFDVSVPFETPRRGAAGTLVAYEESAETGNRINVVRIPVTIAR